MIELEVHNFQSVKRAKVVIDGFTAIEGRTNIGKSSLVRAAQCALTGAVGTDFVRHGVDCERKVKGTKKCKCFSIVKVKTSKVAFVWEKGDGVNRYTVTRPGADKPEVYEGLERGTPEFLLPGFQLVQVGQSKELIQIPDQFEPIFLLNQSGPAVADVLSDVAGLDRINKAIGAVNKDRKEVVSKRKIREGDVDEQKNLLATFEGLDRISVDTLISEGARLESLRGRLSLTEGFLVRVQSLKQALTTLPPLVSTVLPDFEYLGKVQTSLFEVSRLQDKLGSLSDLASILEASQGVKLPDVPAVVDKAKELTTSHIFLDELMVKSSVVDALLGVGSIEVPEDFALGGMGQELQKANDLLVRLESLKGTLRSLGPLDVLGVPDISKLSEGYSTLESAYSFGSELDALEDTIGRGESIGDLPDYCVDASLSKFLEIDDLLNRTRNLATIVQTTTADNQKLELELQNISKDIQGLGTCPICSQSFGAEQDLHLEAL